MVRLREILKEVEAEATGESASEDIETAAHHACERHLAAATGTVDSLGAVVRKTMDSFVIGGAEVDFENAVGDLQAGNIDPISTEMLDAADHLAAACGMPS